MASISLCSQIIGMCNVGIELNGIRYKNIKCKIMNNLCTDVRLSIST